MPTLNSITVENDHSDEAIAEMKQKIEKALVIIGLKAETFAKALCPVDTGNLRNSISTVVEDDAVYIGTNVEYAPYQELGTRTMSATNGGKGFIRPAIEDHIGEYQNILKSELKS